MVVFLDRLRIDIGIDVNVGVQIVVGDIVVRSLFGNIIVIVFVAAATVGVVSVDIDDAVDSQRHQSQLGDIVL
jgi:hypothetical protein